MRVRHPVIALVILTGLLLAPLPLAPLVERWPAMARTLENSAHPLLFWWLASVLLKTFRARLPSGAAAYAAVFVACLAIALGTEYLQSLFGRDSSWEDARNDMLGALFALLLQAGREARAANLPRAHATAVCGAVLVAALSAFPLAWITAAYTWRAATFPVLWRDDTVLARPFFFWKEDAYPGLEIGEPIRDWRGYTALQLRVRSLRAEGTRVYVLVHDVKHNHRFQDRYNAGFDLRGGREETLRIPLEEIRHSPEGRELDLAAVRRIVVFQDYAHEPPRFEVQDIKLVR